MSTEQIKAKLSKCYKKRKPVLLYGDNSTGCLDLVLEVHKMNGGTEQALIYVEEESENMKYTDDRLDKYNIRLKDIIKKGIFSPESIAQYEEIRSELYDEMCEVLPKYFKSTAKAWKYINCESMPGEGVYYELVNRGILDNIEMGDLSSIPIYGSYLFDHKGTLFIDNLYCDPVNDKDIEYYCKLGEEIKKDKISVNWLVAYTYDPEVFPKYFREQFEPIPLGNEIVKPVKEEVPHISIPAGTKWLDVKMVINYGRRKPIDILLKGKQISKIDFSDIGLEYSKTKTSKPIEAMKTFKKFVESENNTVLSKNVKFHHRKTLKDKFCHLFGISEDPFLYIKDEKAYKTLFSIEYKHYTNYPSA